MTGDASARLLAPLGWLYLRVAALRIALYEREWLRSEHVPRPVICLGNISAGGVGKTPAVAWLARRLRERGHRVGIVSRGHGGRRRRDPLVVADGGAPCPPAAEAGDEAVMLAHARAADVIVVARRRVEGAREAIARGADVILLDDGFQHRALCRDLDIALLDYRNPLAGGRGLPAGRLREAPSALARAGVILLTRCPDSLARLGDPLEAGQLPAPLREALRSIPASSRPPVFASTHEPAGWRDSSGAERPLGKLAGRRVFAVAGIGQPESFVRTLEACGCDVAGLAAFRDHHAFDDADAETITARAQDSEAELIVTTEKDAVRWPEGAPAPAVLRIALSLGAEDGFLAHVESAIASPEAGNP